MIKYYCDKCQKFTRKNPKTKYVIMFVIVWSLIWLYAYYDGVSISINLFIWFLALIASRCAYFSLYTKKQKVWVEMLMMAGLGVVSFVLLLAFWAKGYSAFSVHGIIINVVGLSITMGFPLKAIIDRHKNKHEHKFREVFPAYYELLRAFYCAVVGLLTLITLGILILRDNQTVLEGLKIAASNQDLLPLFTIPLGEGFKCITGGIVDGETILLALLLLYLNGVFKRYFLDEN